MGKIALGTCHTVVRYINIFGPVHKVQSQKYFREYASLLSHDFRDFTSLGE